jgi:4-amino-4-deoxy-L-arabinose transferase-like glycosyltransferase
VFWRSPDDQPGWARPALLALAVLAGVAYAWNATGNLEIYYAAAVRSMSMSLHNFFFAAFDPSATITVDKLPGALWLQAIFMRVFGVHAWALVAPQVIEGMASVLVLFRIVRRLSGPVAAIAAATIFVISPATVALNRGNIPDTLMVLLLLLAADATVSAAGSGRRRSLVLAAVLVGLAFQAKMIEAWLVLPALAAAYLVAASASASASWRQRLTRLGVAGIVVAIVSLSWILVVTVWPAGSRPYVDGSSSNSIFSQVFVYNGFGRIDQASPNQLLTNAIGIPLRSPAPGWDRLLTHAVGRDTGWLLPAALIALLICAVLARRRVELRAPTVLWGTWLVVLFVVFSASTTINTYYMGALTPAIAGLIGTGVALAWQLRDDPADGWMARWVTAAAVAAGCGYAAWLVPAHGVGTVAGLRVLVLVLGAAAVILLLTGISRAGTLTLALVATVAAPVAASASVVANKFGPFDTPFETAGADRFARTLGAVAAQTRPLLGPLERAQGVHGALMATQTSAVAAPFIYDSGQEVVPIGGYSGTSPSPSLQQLRSMVARGTFHIVVQAPVVNDPRLRWVARHCQALPSPGPTASGLNFSIYYCGGGFP